MTNIIRFLGAVAAIVLLWAIITGAVITILEQLNDCTYKVIKIENKK